MRDSRFPDCANRGTQVADRSDIRCGAAIHEIPEGCVGIDNTIKHQARDLAELAVGLAQELIQMGL